MAWTAGAVAVLLVTLLMSSSSVHGDDPHINSATKSEVLFLKPTANRKEIIVIAEDKWGSQAFKVTFMKEKCFPSYPTWHFTQVNVTKVIPRALHLNMSVGTCEVNCAWKDQQKDSDTEKVKNIIVTCLGFENYTKTPRQLVDLNKYTFTNCTNELREKRDQPPCSPSAISITVSPKTAQSKGAPSHDLPSKTPPHGRLSKLGIILLMALVVQVLGTAVMAVIVVVVIRRASRTATIIRLDTNEELQEDNISDASRPAKDTHEQE
ncbi:uncharacterized protein LOC135109959 [Scylla paramamosain]|uniref:uncharacterized protein LOC135109959 n=1 Tax=Scylla paramamosain TaxID=85552 RepID=UPI003083121B